MVKRRLVAALCLLVVCGELPAELPEEIRVVSYNIHHGEGVDGEIDLKRIANRILAVEPDLVALQELDQGTRRTKGVDQPAELAKLTGMQVVFGRNIDFQGGGYGTAVLTKLPVRSHEQVKLKSFYPPTAENPEQRGVQVLEIGEKDEPGFLFLNTHLDYRPAEEERLNSARTINELIAKYGDTPAIIAGDFNAVPESETIQVFREEWCVAGWRDDEACEKCELEKGQGSEGEASEVDGGGDAKPQAASEQSPLAEPILTFPAEKPDKWIDYVMYRSADQWEVVEVRVLDEGVASDHRPVLVVLKRKDE
jgi:endonuclease/exonuclease/phosphatase family metal-dependent hydrolase